VTAVAVLPAERITEIRDAYGLCRPLAAQFLGYLHDLLRADLGRSLATHRPVLHMIGERLPWTLSLVGAAVLIAAAVGGALGTAAAGRLDGRGWRLTEPLIIGVGALPEVLVAMALIVVFSGTLRVFPAGGATTPFLVVSGVTGWITAAGDLLWHAALPQRR
jgi:peptide/nickel transport system permease protein